jgi:hypothetical protein
MASANQPLKELAPLLAAVAIFSTTTATLRLKLDTCIKARSDLTPPSTLGHLPFPADAAIASAESSHTPAASTVGDTASPTVGAVEMVTKPSEQISFVSIARDPARLHGYEHSEKRWYCRGHAHPPLTWTTADGTRPVVRANDAP